MTSSSAKVFGSPYDKCQDCCCFYANLEKVGIPINDECSQGWNCQESFKCPCFQKFKEVK